MRDSEAASAPLHTSMEQAYKQGQFWLWANAIIGLGNLAAVFTMLFFYLNAGGEPLRNSYLLIAFPCFCFALHTMRMVRYFRQKLHSIRQRSWLLKYASAEMQRVLVHDRLNKIEVIDDDGSSVTYKISSGQRKSWRGLQKPVTSMVYSDTQSNEPLAVEHDGQIMFIERA